jgi:transcriptional regulator with XRE-family HTH domain
MVRKLKDKLDSLPKPRRARIEKRAAELIDREMTLRDLRIAMNRTQVEIAKKMGVGQDTVSRYESRADLMLSTLERYVTAMGGKLTLLAEFPNRKPTRIRTLGELKADSPELTGESGNGKSGKRAAHS